MDELRQWHEGVNVLRRWIVGFIVTVGMTGVVSAQAKLECYLEQLWASMIESSMSFPAGELGGPVVDIRGNVLGMSLRLTAIDAIVDSLA